MSNEARYYEALRTIAKDFYPVDKLKRIAVQAYGLAYAEAIEMAYENMIDTAAQAIAGKRRPKLKEQP